MKNTEETVIKAIGHKVIVNEHDIIVTSYKKKGTVIHCYRDKDAFEVEFEEKINTVYRYEITKVINPIN